MQSLPKIINFKITLLEIEWCPELVAKPNKPLRLDPNIDYPYHTLWSLLKHTVFDNLQEKLTFYHPQHYQNVEGIAAPATLVDVRRKWDVKTDVFPSLNGPVIYL